jgi:hypothetical protein
MWKSGNQEGEGCERFIRLRLGVVLQHGDLCFLIMAIENRVFSHGIAVDEENGIDSWCARLG